jgi:hypothetical protein
MLVSHTTLSLPLMLGWVFLLAVLGVTMAADDQRRAAALPERDRGRGDAPRAALDGQHRDAVGEGARLGGAHRRDRKLWADGLAVFHPSLAPFTIGTWISALNQRVFGPAQMGRTVMLSWEPMFIAAGAITGLAPWRPQLGPCDPNHTETAFVRSPSPQPARFE